MAFNLLDSARSYLTPDLVDKASRQLGESSSGISKALSAAVPAVFGGFINRAENGDAHGLLNDANEAANSNILNNPQGLFDGGVGGFLSGGIDRLQGMFGSGTNSITSALAGFAGIKSGSVQGLLSMLTPLLLGILGKKAKEDNLSPQGLTSYLSSQKSSIIDALPSGLSLGNLFGGDRPNVTRTKIVERDEPRAYAPDVEKKDSSNLLWWIILGLAAIALIWFLSRGCNGDDTTTTTSDTTTMVTTAPVDTATTTTVVNGTRESMKVRLADGVEIDAYKGGVEDQLVNCLNDAGCTAGKDKWFDFDNINFETGSARLTAESQAQVANIAAILKAYPKAKIKIGGYTDKTGSAAANQTLSQQRAEAVTKAVMAAGANAGQLNAAEGYGSQFAKVDASASDEERRKDRRIAVQLFEK